MAWWGLDHLPSTLQAAPFWQTRQCGRGGQCGLVGLAFGHPQPESPSPRKGAKPPPTHPSLVLSPSQCCHVHKVVPDIRGRLPSVRSHHRQAGSTMCKPPAAPATRAHPPSPPPLPPLTCGCVDGRGVQGELPRGKSHVAGARMAGGKGHCMSEHNGAHSAHFLPVSAHYVPPGALCAVVSSSAFQGSFHPIALLRLCGCSLWLWLSGPCSSAPCWPGCL